MENGAEHGLVNGGDNGAEEEETVVTMSEVIEGLEAQELEADLVLGGDEGKDCTYPKGYMARQAVFSCLTCCPEGNAGVCTACSMSCHDGHEVVELWTRRHFRCDCGNSKFGVGICRLYSSKDAENCENLYNQNYKGLYCTCKRPYPDSDGEEQGEMLQCCICEDWFHETHLGLAPTEQVPRDEEGEPVFDELLCQACAGHLDFILCYSDLLLPPGCSGSIPIEGLVSSEKDKAAVQESVHAVCEVAASAKEVLCTSQETVDLHSIKDNTLQDNASDNLLGTDTQKSSSENDNAAVQEPVHAACEVAVTANEVLCTSQVTVDVHGTKDNTLQDNASDNLLGTDTEKSCQEQVEVVASEPVTKTLTVSENRKAEANGQGVSDSSVNVQKDSVNHCESGALCCKLKLAKDSRVAQGGEKALEKETCSNGGEVDTAKVMNNKALFLAKNWRAQLCSCDECCNMYSVKGVRYLLDSEDTLHKYEEVAKQKRKEKMEAAQGTDLAFFNTLGHVGQIEFLHKLNDMTSEFSSHFASFGESGKTITSADIHEFFDNLKRKRKRLE